MLYYNPKTGAVSRQYTHAGVPYKPDVDGNRPVY